MYESICMIVVVGTTASSNNSQQIVSMATVASRNMPSSAAAATSSSSSPSTPLDNSSAKRAMNDLFLSWMSRTDTEAIVQRALAPFQTAANSTSTPLQQQGSAPTSPSLISTSTHALPSMAPLSLTTIDSTSSNGSNGSGNGITPASPKSARARLLDLATVGIAGGHNDTPDTSSTNTSPRSSSSLTNVSGRPKTPISVVITSAPESPPPSADSNSSGHVRRGSSPLLGGSHLNISEPHSPIDDHNHDRRPGTPLSPGSNLTPRRVPSPSSHRLDINRITASPPRSPLVRGRSPIPSPDSKRKPVCH